jgi:plastocyanin
MRPLVFLATAAMLVCARTLSQAQSTSSPAPLPTPTPVAIVHVQDFAYDPGALEIHVGDDVAFINDDEIAHTVTSDDKAFDSGNLDQHQTWTYTFTKAGTYTYYCTYHPFMKAKIVVVAPSPTAS